LAIDSSLENAGEINLEEARTQRKKKVYKPSRMIGTVVQKKKELKTTHYFSLQEEAKGIVGRVEKKRRKDRLISLSSCNDLIASCILPACI